MLWMRGLRRKVTKKHTQYLCFRSLILLIPRMCRSLPAELRLCHRSAKGCYCRRVTLDCSFESNLIIREQFLMARMEGGGSGRKAGEEAQLGFVAHLSLAPRSELGWGRQERVSLCEELVE